MPDHGEDGCLWGGLATSDGRHWLGEFLLQLLELLEDKLEIEERFDDLEERVKYVNDMLKFFLEEKEGHAMERLVILVVIILVLELAISTFEFWEHHAKPTVSALQDKWTDRALQARASKSEPEPATERV